tara:strand:- start:220 stop:384 length:165 start_codon:yes stop_codon:yes gene_type:complete
VIKFDIIKISKKLRKGDQVMIWHDGYQIHLKGVGTSNFHIPKEEPINNVKRKKP